MGFVMLLMKEHQEQFVVEIVIYVLPEAVEPIRVVCKKNKGYDKNNEEKDKRFYFRRKEDSKRIHHD